MKIESHPGIESTVIKTPARNVHTRIKTRLKVTSGTEMEIYLKEVNKKKSFDSLHVKPRIKK